MDNGHSHSRQSDFLKMTKHIGQAEMRQKEADEVMKRKLGKLCEILTILIRLRLRLPFMSFKVIKNNKQFRNYLLETL